MQCAISTRPRLGTGGRVGCAEEAKLGVGAAAFSFAHRPRVPARFKAASSTQAIGGIEAHDSELALPLNETLIAMPV